MGWCCEFEVMDETGRGQVSTGRQADRRTGGRRCDQHLLWVGQVFRSVKEAGFFVLET
jgi:hypothetical protein